MFLFVLNSDSFVGSSVQITRVRQKQARLRRVGWGGRLGHFLSLNTFQITKKFPHPVHSLLPTLVPSIFGFHMLWYYTPLSHQALARLLQKRCIPLDCTKHSWENGWQFQNLVTIARMSTSHIHAPFPPFRPCSWLTCLTHCWPIERPGLSGFGSCLCPCLAQFLSVYACLYPHRPRQHKCLAT